MAQACKFRKRWGPPKPHRFGCHDARRAKWGCLLCETRTTDGTFGVVAQTIPPSCVHGGEAAGSWRHLTLANVGVALLRLGQRTSPFGYLSFDPKVLRGSGGTFSKVSPAASPTNLNLHYSSSVISTVSVSLSASSPASSAASSSRATLVKVTSFCPSPSLMTITPDALRE